MIAEEARTLARAAGEARLAELKAAKTEAAKTEAGKGADGFSTARTVSRNAPAGLSQPALEAVFRLAAEPVPAFTGVDLGTEGYTIVELVRTLIPTAQELAQKGGAYDAQIERVAAQQDVGSYVESIKARTKIVRHPERIGAKADAKQP